MPTESCAPEKTTCRCAWPWLSGLFAAPAFVHLVRLLAGWEVTIGGKSIPMSISWAGAIVFGVLAIVCGILGCRKRGAGLSV
jgi:hypothetical protein